jgi:hypothetical protein
MFRIPASSLGLGDEEARMAAHVTRIEIALGDRSVPPSPSNDH